MTDRYFDLQQNLYIPGLWYLDEPTDRDGKEVDDIWQFTEGRELNISEPLLVPLYRPGHPLDFSTTAAAATPIVHAKVASVFEKLAPGDVQLFPVQVEGQPGPHFLLNATRLVKCIDDARCAEVLFWTPEDGQPAKTGQYRSVARLRIDATKVGNTRVFRPWGWPVVLIVSDDIKAALERTGATGLKFTEV